MNVDRSDEYNSPTTPNLIYAFAPKDSDYVTFKTVTTKAFNEALYGDTITFNYPLSASIVRDYHELDTDEKTPSEKRFRPRKKTISPDGLPQIVDKDTNLTVSSSLTDALRNTFDYYTVLSRHFAYSASHPAWNFGTYDKGHQEMGLIYIPSIFYGSSIKKGSVSLKWYVSGSLMAECTDRERNGELIQVSGSGRPSANDDSPEVITNYADTIHDSATGSVAGVILYNEGVIALTGTWSLHDEYTDKFRYTNNTGVQSAEPPKWTYFGVGANDGSGSVVSHDGATVHNVSSSFTLEFKGTNYVPVMTMMAHASKGELNFSNNPTFISGSYTTTSSGQKILTGSNVSVVSSSVEYHQDEKVKIKNIVSSSYSNHAASFASHTYISKIGLYDEKRNLIGIAKLATPVKKTEDREFTFKLKLDY